MKFTSEDLMKAMGLKVGDRVACLDSRYIFKVIEHKGNVYLECVNAKLETQFIHYLLNVDFEILPQPKRVGDLDIDDKDIYYKYKLVPLLDYKSNLCDWGIGVPEPENLYEVLEHWQKYNKDQEIYDILKARLDKEVEE